MGVSLKALACHKTWSITTTAQKEVLSPQPMEISLHPSTTQRSGPSTLTPTTGAGVGPETQSVAVSPYKTA